MYTDLKSFYKSDEWEKFRQIILLERIHDDGILYCEYSGLPILKKYDAVVHHKIELTEDNVHDATIALNPDNVMVVSFKSHNKIHQRFGYEEQKVYIVYGSPCAGKNTWVEENAEDDDLIIDLDRIWSCICNSDKYNKPNRLKSIAFNVRDSMIDMVRTRTGKWNRCFYIATLPLVSERERMSKLLGAELIFIEEEKEVCLSRCITDEWKDYVEDWFDTFTA